MTRGLRDNEHTINHVDGSVAIVKSVCSFVPSLADAWENSKHVIGGKL